MLKRLAVGLSAVIMSVLYISSPVFAAETRVNFTPLDNTIYEGETTAVEVRLTEPIISSDPDEAFVSIALTSSVPGAVSFNASPVVFDDSEWSSVKTFEITAADNGTVNEDVMLTITGTTSSGSEFYDAFVNTMQITVVDNDGPEDDLNGDSIPDNTQANIGGYVSSITGKTVAMDVGAGCELTTDDIAEESFLDVQDTDYEYANGLFDIEGDCGTPGFTTTIKFYYYDVDSDNLVFRKYNPTTQEYANVEDAAVSYTHLIQTLVKKTLRLFKLFEKNMIQNTLTL